MYPGNAVGAVGGAALSGVTRGVCMCVCVSVSVCVYGVFVVQPGNPRGVSECLCVCMCIRVLSIIHICIELCAYMF